MSFKTNGLMDLSTDDDVSKDDSSTSLPSDMLLASSDIGAPVPVKGEEDSRRPRARKSAEKAQQQIVSKPKTTTKRKRPTPKLLPIETPRTTGPFKPKRDYYHSTSFLKIKDSEWENDVDSDGELDQSWLREIERSVSDCLFMPRVDVAFANS